MKKYIQSLITSVVAIILLGIISSVYTFESFAQSSLSSVRGYAWSAFGLNTGDDSTGIGWVSFNSGDPGTSGSYSVSYNAVTDDLSGHAWTPNYGWLSFDRSVTGNPPGALIDDPGQGTGPIAKKQGNQIIGWARFIAACQDDLWVSDEFGGRCTGVGAGNKNGIISALAPEGQGWDGWVSLSKKSVDTINYGLTVDAVTGSIEGFGWGGPVNVGWINFKQENINPIPLDPNDPPEDTIVTPRPPVDPVPPTPDPVPPVSSDPVPPPPCENCVYIGSNPLVAECSVTLTPSSGEIIGTAAVNVRWDVNVYGGVGSRTVTWANVSDSGITSGTPSPAMESYNQPGTKIANATITDARGSISKSCSVTISKPGSPAPSCSPRPSNATLCPGSADGGNSPSLVDHGSCPSGEVIDSCSFECNADYVRRGASCIRKSSVIEQ